jgi:cell division protein FtsW (lipid II flippase)
MSAATIGTSPLTMVPAPRRPARVGEIILLILALGIGLLAYAQVGWSSSGKLPPHFAVVAAGAGGALLIVHIAVRILAPYSDQVLLPVAAALNGIGLSLIYRLDVAGNISAAANGRPAPAGTAPTQLLWTGLGLVLLITVLLIVRDARRLQRLTYTALVGAVALLLLPLLPHIGVEINGARIWIHVAGLSFQPAEIAKILLAIFFAGYLAAKRDALAVARTRVLGLDLPRGRDLGPLLLAWGISVAILFVQNDIGMSLLFFGLFVAMLYVATGRRSWVVLGTFLFAVGSVASYFVINHVHERVQVWLHPFSDPANTGYQMVQSLYGLSAGGVLGTGIGQGSPNLVPFAKSDFIVATVGEELGLTGLMAILVMYAILVERGLTASLASRDVFSRLLACGLAFTMALQVFVVVGGVTGLIPLTGLTTPFLAAGGSSLIANWIVIALLLRISDSARRPEPTPAPVSGNELTQVLTW